MSTKQSWDEIMALGIAWAPGEMGSDTFWLLTIGGTLKVSKGDWIESDGVEVKVNATQIKD